MKDDYSSTTFNSYDEGPGKFLQRSNDGYTLFIDTIPVSLTQVSYILLCGQMKCMVPIIVIFLLRLYTVL